MPPLLLPRQRTATRIRPRLWMGGAPPEGDYLRMRGFGAVVLCAVEHQPASERFPGLWVLHAPNDDAGRPPTVRELEIATKAAKAVARLVRSDVRVLVTCAEGRNRSGLVVALAMMLLDGLAGAEAVRRVKELRARALTNEHFVRLLERLEPRAAAPFGSGSRYDSEPMR